MISKQLDKIHQENMRNDADFVNPEIGNVVRVHVKIKEGGKERVQVYTGTVIGRKGTGATETFTVRRISHGVGVERVFPVHSPHVAKIELESRGHARRAKLYYLRNRVGKSAKLRATKKNK